MDKDNIRITDPDVFANRPVTMNEGNNLLQIEEHMYILEDRKSVV